MLKKNQKYYPFLNGVRAIAAFMVAFSHALLVFKVQGYQSVLTNIILIPINSDAAIIFFFLISSLVVGNSLENHIKQRFHGIVFYIKRIIRLYPTYFASFILSIIILTLFQNRPVFPDTTDWYNRWFSFDLTNIVIWENLRLKSFGLNSNAWTLQIEFIAMFMLPILVSIKKKTYLIEDFIIGILIFLIGYKQNQYINLVYIFPIYIGLLIRKWGPKIFKIKLLTSRVSLGIFLLLLLFSTTLIPDVHIRVGFETFCGFYILGYLINAHDKKAVEILSSNLLMQLGKISYSYYLLHTFVLYLLTYTLIHYFSKWYNPQFAFHINIVLGIFSYILTIPVAKLIYIYIEKPSMTLARVIARKFQIY